MNKAEYFASKLLQIKAIKLSPQNPFTWASGAKSPIYCDNRVILSHPEFRTEVAQKLNELCTNFEPYNYVAGVATAGIAHGALIAHLAEKPMVYVRSKPKAHGRKNQIEGQIQKGQSVVMIEDLISTGGSVIQAADALRAEGIEVKGVVAIFTYGLDKAKQNLEAAGLAYKTITDYPILLEEAVKASYITPQDLEQLNIWRKDPANWMVTS